MESIELNSKNSGGIDIERLINKDYLNPLGDFYKCSICSKIMINPTDCENCGHSFCYDCISKTKCPFGCENKNLKPASNGITNSMSHCSLKAINKTHFYISLLVLLVRFFKPGATLYHYIPQ